MKGAEEQKVESWVRSGFWVLGSGFWVLGSEYWVLDYLLRGTSFRQILRHAIQHAVDEVHGLWRGELPGDFQSFVDHDRGRGLWEPQKLGNSRSQHIAIDSGHTFHSPVWRVRLDHLVDRLAALNRHTKNVVCKSANVLVHFLPFGPEGLAHVVRRLLSHVELEKHLQRQLPRFPPRTGRLFLRGSFALRHDSQCGSDIPA